MTINKFLYLNYTVLYFTTGYEYDLPFLTPEESCLRIENGKFISPLYRHMINISYPTMALIGLPFRNCPFMLFDCQVVIQTQRRLQHLRIKFYMNLSSQLSVDALLCKIT